jgi:nicotinate phosphoribosyltransferase
MHSAVGIPRLQAGEDVKDLYQLTMGQAYFELGMRDIAVFELFVRRLPKSRRFLLAGGLAQVVEYLERLEFTSQDLDYLDGLGFKPAFLDHLRALRFTGSLHAMPEGCPFFADEPVLRITAPILEAQLIESRLLNIVHFQTLIASKAARCALAAGGRQLIDFGMRRAHEGQAALYAARAAYLAGFSATATVEAGREFGIPLSGTMAHSFIEAHDSEEAAFRNFLASYPEEVTLLVDTYDTQRGTEYAARLARELATRKAPGRVRAIRIDSGDLAQEARVSRAILNEHLRYDVRIVLSGSLDEHRIEQLASCGVPADAFGVGTALAVSDDAPSLDMAYKLQEYAGRPRRKRSPGKETWPGAKQVFREHGSRGHILRDQLGRAEEDLPGEPLLLPVLVEGRRVRPQNSIEGSPRVLRATAGDVAGVSARPLRRAERPRIAGAHFRWGAGSHKGVRCQQCLDGPRDFRSLLPERGVFSAHQRHVLAVRHLSVFLARRNCGTLARVNN